MAVQIVELKPPLSGVHFSSAPEYMLLQHPFLHWEFEEHKTQSPSDPSVGGDVVGPVMWGLLVLGALVVGSDVVSEDVGADIAMVNQFMFQPSPVTLILRGSDSALKFTVCDTVCQFCQPPVHGMVTVPNTGVPPALSSCKLPPKPATRYDTVYVPEVGIVTAG